MCYSTLRRTTIPSANSIALRANNATTIRGLNRLAGSPAEIEALTWTDPSDGMEKPLPIDSKEDTLDICTYEVSSIACYLLGDRRRHNSLRGAISKGRGVTDEYAFSHKGIGGNEEWRERGEKYL